MPEKLERKLGLFQSTVINMIDMVGIGPFVVLPLVIDIMGGPYFLYAWLAGAFISFIDAMRSSVRSNGVRSGSGK